ncbi:hypothetical protein MTP10_13025 [Nonomuraea sp. 3-1Str]|nr:hypothetical protein [Nonomuraea sp. 3-1Str]MDR8409661.1 hypothetical protein [Nonomuraea sp. 3-1Str]
MRDDELDELKQNLRPWNDAGFECIMVSRDDLQSGTFASVAYEQDGLH